MGLDQAILRNKYGDKPRLDEDGEWENAKELLTLRKAYWLHNRVMEIGKEKYDLPVEILNTECIELTKEELYDILEDSKKCVNERSEHLVMKLFDTGLFYTDYDFHLCLDSMKRFNKIMANALRNKKQTRYFYWSWW